MNDLSKNAKFGTRMGRFFKMFLNLSQNWLKFKKILEKVGDFAQNFSKNWADYYKNGSLFPEKFVFVWIYFQTLESAHPYQNHTWVPPRVWLLLSNQLLLP